MNNASWIVAYTDGEYVSFYGCFSDEVLPKRAIRLSQREAQKLCEKAVDAGYGAEMFQMVEYE